MRIHARQTILALVLAAVASRDAAAQRPTTRVAAVRPRNALAAEEIAAFLILLNGYDRVAYRNQYYDGQRVYASTFATTWKHITTQHWVHDTDPFNINQFAHPYQGATMYGLARTTGHSFWTSLLYSNVGSFAWKMAGETDPPSINDMITTGQAGSLLGEALYRMADLVLKNGGVHQPWWHRYLAIVASPPMAVNERVLGHELQIDLPDTVPATTWQMRLGGITDVVASNVSTPTARLHDVVATFSMAYGLPGAPGYTYRRPLDYFEFQGSFLSRARNPIENVTLRGLLAGRRTGSGAERGIWGLYGSYDYISPYLFRVSSTALSLGTTRQYWLAPAIALQGSLLGGVGYGAAGSTAGIPATPTSEAIRDYHFGVTPQGLLDLRLIGGERVMLEGTGREYYVSGAGSDDKHGSEQIFRGDFGVDVSLFGGHTVGVHWLESTRRAHYATVPGRSYSEGTVTLTYTFLGHNHFGAVRW